MHAESQTDGSAVDNDRILSGAYQDDASALPPYLQRGVLFNIARLDRVACLPGDRVIGADDLKRAQDGAGITLQPGDVALIRTGWACHWGRPDYIAPETPGPDHAAGLWLADKGAALVGCDMAVFKKGPVTEAAPVHRLMLFERRIPILENLDLEALSVSLAEASKAEFLFAALARGAIPPRPCARWP